jgi:transcriptional regulator
MYKVDKYEVTDLNILYSVIEKYPFATVLSAVDGDPFVNHLPITAEKLSDGKLRLLGHMSTRNPQWRYFESGAKALIAFNGPNTYINPNWYTENDVPTWNYISVHAKGSVQLIKDYKGLLEILKKTTDQMNHMYSEKWDFYLPPDLQSESDVTNSIIGFELIPTQLIGKFKLSQNRNWEDQKNVIAGLSARSDEESQQVAKWMSKLTK